MTITELKQSLEEAYSLKNLNRISLTLINLYKDRQYTILGKIAEIVCDFVEVEISSEGKGFSKLIKMYHPDRYDYYNNEIKKLAAEGNFDGLLELSHILKLERIDEIAESLNSFEDIDYSPVYEWDMQAEGFSIIDDSGKDSEPNIKHQGYDFYDAIKIRQYGHTGIEFPSHYLEDTEEFELSSSDIIDLDGVQFCIHAKNIDLSDNRIIDLTPLCGLSHLEELNISYNHIEIIDDLVTLANLRKLNISNNRINDVSALFDMEKLEYIDLTGNNVSQDQINKMVESGITVDY